MMAAAGGNEAVELQLQMRQNAEEVHTFMRELDSWETEIKMKDKQLRNKAYAVMDMDKEDSPVESNDSDSEETASETKTGRNRRPGKDSVQEGEGVPGQIVQYNTFLPS